MSDLRSSRGFQYVGFYGSLYLFTGDPSRLNGGTTLDSIAERRDGHKLWTEGIL